MKLLERNDAGLVFHLARQEKQLLQETLRLYPVLPADFQPLSKTGDSEQLRAAQQLLEESLAEQKQQNQRLLEKLAADPERFAVAPNGWHFRLAAGEIEWFLQVLNDIRVGSWRRAGCPEELHDNPEAINEQTLPHFWAMEVSGFFQCLILEALAD